MHVYGTWALIGSSSPLLCESLPHLLPVHVDDDSRLRDVRRQPRLGVLVVERPRGDDDEEGQGGAGEADVDGELDVLGHEADEEGKDLAP